MHRVATLLTPAFAGPTILLCQVKPTWTVGHWLALAIGLGEGLQFLLDDGGGQLGALTAPVNIAQVGKEDSYHERLHAAMFS